MKAKSHRNPGRQGRRMVDRSAYIGARCPKNVKDRLEEIARRRGRDLSSLAVEYIAAGIANEPRD